MTTSKKLVTQYISLISLKFHTLSQLDIYDTLSWCGSQIGMKFLPIYFAITNYIGLIPKEKRYTTQSIMFLIVSSIYGLFSVYLNLVKPK